FAYVLTRKKLRVCGAAYCVDSLNACNERLKRLFSTGRPIATLSLSARGAMDTGSNRMKIEISDKLLYLGVGCGIRLFVGTLIAPKSGQETRKDLSDKVDDLSDKVQKRFQSSGIGQSAGQTYRNAVERGKNVASIGRQRFNEAIEAGKSKFKETIET